MRLSKLSLCLPIAVFLLLAGCKGPDNPQDTGTVNTPVTIETPGSSSPAADAAPDEKDLADTAETVNNKEDNTMNESESILKEEAPEPTAMIEDIIPVKYRTPRYQGGGTLELISYPTKDYFGDGSDITKKAYVYLPEGYSTDKQYNVLILMHGIGGNIKEWGMCDNSSVVKAIMDNLTYNTDIDPFIVVAANGRSSKDFDNTNSDHNSFYLFGQELRNDLIPYIDSNYATYAVTGDDYNIADSRDHRAMAGLSMGAMQTINIGMGECLDLFSYFGAFSSCPTTNTAAVTAEKITAFPDYDIHYFYNICGTGDDIALASATAATEGLCDLTDKLTDGENYMWQTVPGGHTHSVWYLGFYNFAQLVFH